MTSSPPEVSVVIGVRNEAESLPATFASLRAQEGVRLELVVIDDGSSDRTRDVLEAAADEDSRFRVVCQAAMGLTAALRRGCELATAPLVARHDAGDVSHPSRLRLQSEILARHQDVVLASCWTDCRAPGGELLYEVRGEAEPDRPVDILRRAGASWSHVGPTSHGSTMFRRADYLAAGGYRLEFALGQDWDLWLRLGERGRFLCVGRTLYTRTIAPRSLSMRMRGLQHAFGEASTEACRLRLRGASEEPALARARGLRVAFDDAVRREPSRRTEALGNYHLGEVLRRRGDHAAMTYLKRSIAIAPWMLRAWIRWAQATMGCPGRSRRR